MNKETEIFIQGATGKLQARYCDVTNAKAIILLCHPDPTQEGTMLNKVITTAQRTARDAGISTLRFNYRGVMQSEGMHHMQGGEIDDALSCLNWLIAKHSNAPVIIGGFSFGGFVAASVALKLASKPNLYSNIDLHSLILIAPAIGRLVNNVTKLPCRASIIAPTNDEILDPNQLLNWHQQLTSAHKFYPVADCSHFFHGKLVELKTIFNQIFNQTF